MDSKILKELIIILLLVIVIIFALVILFYDNIITNNDEISSVQYTVDENVNTTLQEIQANSGVDINAEDNLLKSYTINQEDLTTYANENYYESGKQDPFAETSETVEEVETTTTTNVNKNTTQSNNNYTLEEKNENTTSGTFFENKSSK